MTKRSFKNGKGRIVHFFCVLLHGDNRKIKSTLIQNREESMRKRQLFIVTLLGMASAAAVVSCSDSKTESLQSKIDSLNSVVEQQAQDLEYSQGCLNVIAESIDSIAMADSTLIRVTSAREGTVTKESLKEDLNGYVNILRRQRERLSALESKLSGSNKDMAKLNNLISYLNKQIEAKDAQIKELQDMLELRNFDIAMLQGKVNQLSTMNTDLQSTVATQQEAIGVAQEMLNEAYCIIGTSKELKEAGVLSKKFMGKSKVNVDNINSELFTKLDIRQTTSIHIDSDKPTLKSQHPSNSYRIVPDKKHKTAEIQIVDEIDFWSLTRYLIIQK